MGLQAGKIGQFVDAFLADHGGIHVGEKQLLAPCGPRLHHDIDRQVAARLAQRGVRCADVLGSPAKGISTATSSNSHCAGPAREEWRARHRPPCYRARGRRDCRSAWRQETLHVISHQEKTTTPCLSQGRPPAASRRWRWSLRERPAASSSMPIPCRSIATSGSSRRGRRLRKRRAFRTGSMAMSMPR